MTSSDCAGNSENQSFIELDKRPYMYSAVPSSNIHRCRRITADRESSGVKKVLTRPSKLHGMRHINKCTVCRCAIFEQPFEL